MVRADLAESALAGYTAGAWSCDGGTLVGSAVTLGAGDRVTCTINNDDVAPTLKLVKTVTNNDGGDAVADDDSLLFKSLKFSAGRPCRRPATRLNHDSRTLTQATLSATRDLTTDCPHIDPAK